MNGKFSELKMAMDCGKSAGGNLGCQHDVLMCYVHSMQLVHVHEKILRQPTSLVINVHAHALLVFV